MSIPVIVAGRPVPSPGPGPGLPGYEPHTCWWSHTHSQSVVSERVLCLRVACHPCNLYIAGVDTIPGMFSRRVPRVGKQEKRDDIPSMDAGKRPDERVHGWKARRTRGVAISLHAYPGEHWRVARFHVCPSFSPINVLPFNPSKPIDSRWRVGELGCWVHGYE